MMVTYGAAGVITVVTKGRYFLPMATKRHRRRPVNTPDFTAAPLRGPRGFFYSIFFGLAIWALFLLLLGLFVLAIRG